MIKVLLGIIILFFCMSCGVHKTYYQPIVKTGTVLPEEHIYRLQVTNVQSFSIINDAKLQHLRSLDLSGLATSDISLIIKGLPKPLELRVLILDSIKGTQLPLEVQSLTNLMHLSLIANPSLDIEKALDIVQNLPIKFLNLQHNQLSKVPEKMVHFQNLEDLNLSHNSIIASGSYRNLINLPKLHSLWVNYNMLQRIPTALLELTQLRALYIEHNELTTIPKKIQRMKRLWILHAGHNKFTEMPIALADMPGLILLHINNNTISKISDRFMHKKLSILGLIMDHNSLSEQDTSRWRKEFRKFFILSF